MDGTQRTRQYLPAGRPNTEELAESSLRRSAYLALRQLSCEFRAGVLTLRGRLPSYYLKQMAQAAVAAVEGVERVDNQIEVVAHAASLPRAGHGPHNAGSP